MNKFIDEEKNMLENDPEIRDTSLRRKPSFFEKLLWNGRRKSTTLTALAIAVPTAIVCAFSACAPQADEEQQKAYASYVAAFEKYQTAVNEYNKLEVTDKPALPQSLVIANNLDDKATTEQLKNKTEALNNATAEINGLRETLKNKQTQQAAYQSYLSAWGTYENAVAEYDKLENTEKPALLANLVLTKDLNDKATTKELNDARTALENATAEINKLIKQYEQETPTPPNPPIDYDKLTPADLTEEQKNTIVTKVTEVIKDDLKLRIVRTGVVNEVMAIEFENNTATMLINYTNSTVGNNIMLIKYTLGQELNYKTLLTETLSNTSLKAEILTQITPKSTDSRAEEALKKLKDDNQVTYSDLTNVTNLAITGSSIDTTLGCGATGVVITRIDKDKIIKYSLMVKSDGSTKDMIGENLINGTLGTTYRVVEKFEYKFGENVILLGEMFQGGQAQENENIDA